MARKPVGGVILELCPKCQDELINVGLNREGGYYEKQCPTCCGVFRRIKGYGHHWFQVDEMEI